MLWHSDGSEEVLYPAGFGAREKLTTSAHQKLPTTKEVNR